MSKTINPRTKSNILKNTFQSIFSVRNDLNYKVISILGRKQSAQRSFSKIQKH